MAYAVWTIFEVHRRYPEAEKVNFRISKKQKISHHMATFHETIRNYLEQPEGGLVGDLIAADMEGQPTLQAADMLCWHFQRYYAKTMDRTDEGRLAMLINDRNGIKIEWKREELEGIADRLAATQERMAQ